MREIESIPLKETRVAEEVNAICAMEEGGERRVFDYVWERERKKESESEFGKEKCLGSFADNTTVRQSQEAWANGKPALECSLLTIYCTWGTAAENAHVIFIHFFS